jgi:nitrite reductase (NADH) small subunit
VTAAAVRAVPVTTPAQAQAQPPASGSAPAPGSAQAQAQAQEPGPAEWTAACRYAALEPERGVVALVGGVPVAVFRVHDGQVYALDNIDPFCGASVLARGIVGTRGDVPTVASPMHKHVFDLRTGRCLDDPAVVLRTYPVRVRDGVVEVGGAG